MVCHRRRLAILIFFLALPGAAPRAQEAAARAKDAYARAIELEARGNSTAALSLLWEAAGLAPHDADVQNRLGEALDRMGALDAAADAYRRAVAGRPDFQKAINNLILMLVKAGKGPEAVERARAFLAQAPDDPNRHFTLGLAQSEQDVVQAIAHLSPRAGARSAAHAGPLQPGARAEARGPAARGDRHAAACDRDRAARRGVLHARGHLLAAGGSGSRRERARRRGGGRAALRRRPLHARRRPGRAARLGEGGRVAAARHRAAAGSGRARTTRSRGCCSDPATKRAAGRSSPKPSGCAGTAQLEQEASVSDRPRDAEARDWAI